MPNKRKQIVAAVKARFEAMTTAGGYSLNYASKVYVWRKTPFTEEECTSGVLNIVHRNSNPFQELHAGSANRWHRSLHFEIDIPANGTLSIDTVMDREEDVEKAIGTDLTWGGLAVDTVWTGNDEEKEQEELSISNGMVTFDVIYSTTQWASE